MEELIKRLSQKVKAYDDGAMTESELHDAIGSVLMALKPHEVIGLVRELLFKL